MKWVGGIFCPLPSFFDILSIGIFAILFFKEQFQKEIFFIFYSIFLLCFSICLKEKRKYSSIPLFLINLWGFLNVFIHSFFLPKESLVFKYKNLYLLSEGYIYILFASLLFILLMRYLKNPKLLFLLCIPAVFILLKRQYTVATNIFTYEYYRLSLWFSIIVACIIYFLFKRRYKLLVLSIVTFLGLFFIYFERIMDSLFMRGSILNYFISSIKEHPFVGSGFNKLLLPDNMILNDKFGGLYKHSDILNITACLGLPIFIFILWLIFECVRRIGLQNKLIIFLSILIVSTFQLTMFNIEKATICILLTVFCLMQKEVVRC